MTRGEKNNTTKLTEQQVREIRQRRANGEIKRVLAAEYGVSIPTIKAILSRRNWPHVI